MGGVVIVQKISSKKLKLNKSRWEYCNIGRDRKASVKSTRTGFFKSVNHNVIPGAVDPQATLTLYEREDREYAVLKIARGEFKCRSSENKCKPLVSFDGKKKREYDAEIQPSDRLIIIEYNYSSFVLALKKAKTISISMPYKTEYGKEVILFVQFDRVQGLEF